MITPDTKNWTWVLDRPCPECGFDASTVQRTDLGNRLQANAAAWPAILSRPDVRNRPSTDIWSPLEYACHVRDTFRIFSERLRLMTTQADPAFANWDQDETALAGRYDAQDPDVVAGELTAAADIVADGFDAVVDWSRTGRRSDGSTFTVETLGLYLLHDPVHHLWDVTKTR